MRRIDYLVVHCTATKEGQAVSVDTIRQWHKERGFNDIGYHYVIDLEGKVYAGRDVAIAGAHVTGYNANSIGICYVGGLDKSGKAKDTRNDKQRKALEQLLCRLRERYPNAAICGHRDFSRDMNGNGVIDTFERIKECPCFDAKVEYRNI